MSLSDAKTLILKDLDEWKKYCSKNRIFIWDIFNGDIETDTFVSDEVKTQYIISEMEYQCCSAKIFSNFISSLSEISTQNLERIYNNPIFGSIRVSDEELFINFSNQHPNNEILSKMETSLFREAHLINDDRGTYEEIIDDGFLQNKEWDVLIHILQNYGLDDSELVKLFSYYYKKMIPFNSEKDVIDGMIDDVENYWSHEDRDTGTALVFMKWLKDKVDKETFEEGCYYLIEDKIGKEMFVFLRNTLS